MVPHGAGALGGAPQGAVDRGAAEAEHRGKLGDGRVGADLQLEERSFTVRDPGDPGGLAADLLEEVVVREERHRLVAVLGDPALAHAARKLAAQQVDGRAAHHASQPGVEAGDTFAAAWSPGDAQPGLLRHVVGEVAAASEPS